MFGNPYSMGIDSLARAPRPRGLLGSMGRSIVATPEQEEESRRLAERFGMVQATVQDAPPQQTLGGLLGEAPEAPKGFWQGGRKFTGRDAIAGLLATVGDAIAMNRGGKAFAMSNLTDGRKKGFDAFEESVKAYKRNQQVANLPGMTPREYLAYASDPKGWGGHMSDALSSHHAAANVNPGDQRVFGNPNEGGSVYQAPTAAEQYAGALGEQAGTDDYRTAVQDYVLRGSGPTAFGFDAQLDDHRTHNDMSMEGLRQRNRIGLEGVRQGNRSDLRGQPTYRDLNPSAPRSSAPRRKANPTATGKNGEKYEYNGSEWVRVR